MALMKPLVTDPIRGPIIGHTEPGRTRVWIAGSADQRAVLRWRAENPGSLRQWHYERIDLVPQLDWTGVRELDFGVPGRFVIEAGLTLSGPNVDDATLAWENLSDAGRGRVAAEYGDDGFSFLLGSCRHRGFGPWRHGDHAMMAMAEMLKKGQPGPSPAFLLLCGDQVYCDHPIDDVVPIVSAAAANTPPTSLEGYLERYRHDYADAGFREVTRSLPTYMMFDDHEVRNNWAGYKYRNYWRPKPGKSLQPPWPLDTLKWGLTSYLAYQASHSPLLQPGRAAAAAASILTQPWWYQFSWANADFLVLDTRSDREDPEKPAAAMLGPAQMAALEQFVSQDEARWKFVVSAVPLAPDTRSWRPSFVPDTWRLYTEQRRVLLEMFEKQARRMPIFLGGDLHLSTAVRITGVGEKSVHCILASALNWFTFGVQARGGPISLVSEFTEEGPLAGAPRFRVEKAKDASELRNNFVKVDVTAGEVRFTCFRIVDEKSVVASWTHVVRANEV